MTKTKTKIKLSKQTRKLCVRRAPLCVAGIQLGWCAIARAQVSDVEGIYKLASKTEEKREHFALFLFYYIFGTFSALRIDKFGVFARRHYISAPATTFTIVPVATVHVLVLSSASSTSFGMLYENDFVLSLLPFPASTWNESFAYTHFFLFEFPKSISCIISLVANHKGFSVRPIN